MQKINGVLLYVCAQKPVPAYQAAGEDAKAPEWKVSVALSEDDADAYEEYAKSINAKVSLKKVKTAEFEGIYKCPAPEDAGKYVYVATLRKSTELGKTGKPVPDAYKPRVFQRKGSTLVDITATHLVGNGSKGSVSLDVFERKNGTASIYLKNILVEDLVEYEREEGEYAEPGSEFDDAPVAKPASKPAAKPAAKQKAKVEDEDLLPF